MSTPQPPLHVVWIKRDARVHDHPALVAACDQPGEVVALHVFEPSFWQAEEHDAQHFHFVVDGLRELGERLDAIGVPLLLRVGELPGVFAELHATRPMAGLWAHEETGNRLTYDRDLRVHAWARDAGVPFVELSQTGVIRRLRSRDGWAKRWRERMEAPVLAPPATAQGARGLDPGTWPKASLFGLEEGRRPLAQRGGEARGREMLHGFLHTRGQHYRSAMSSPLDGWDACSRISPWLAWGQLSVRTAYRQTRDRLDALKEARANGERPPAAWGNSLRSFEKRLAWHCHFMQKLEDEPEIEFRNINRGFDGLREDAFDEARFAALRAGLTGYPMVDACVRALHQAGWLNFRMRAMIASFSAYHLWLHWRRPALWLAAQFQDYEPGIHFSQMQMQSGVTGINTVRIYSPIKQVHDQDPEGTFIRRFVPELANVPTRWIAEPHQMPPLTQLEVGVRIGVDYPEPIVDHATAYRSARERVHAWKRRPEVREESREVYARHGSRKRPRPRR